MEGIVYHGSKNGNIKELVAHKSTHQIECIYASASKVVPLLFISRGNCDLDRYVSFQNGNLVFVERREGIFKEQLAGVPGYLYELDGSTFEHYNFLWGEEVISYEKSIKPLRKTLIPDIYEEILKAEENGLIKVYHYPNRPENLPLDNSDLIDKYIKYENSGLKGSIDSLLKIYPEFEMAVQERLSETNVKGKSL